MAKFIKFMQEKWTSLTLDEGRTVLIENRAIEGSKKILFAFFDLGKTSIREDVSFLMEKGEKNDVLRAVYAAFARRRPGEICSRDPGLLSLLRKQTSGTKLTMLFPDRLVKTKEGECVPLILLLNRYFENKARTIVDANCKKQTEVDTEQTVVFDSIF